MLLNTLEMGWTLLPPPTKVFYAEARDVPPPVHHRNLSPPSPRFDDQHTCDLAVRLLCPSDPARLGVAVSFARFLRESGGTVSREFHADRSSGAREW